MVSICAGGRPPARGQDREKLLHHTLPGPGGQPQFQAGPKCPLGPTGSRSQSSSGPWPRVLALLWGRSCVPGENRMKGGLGWGQGREGPGVAVSAGSARPQMRVAGLAIWTEWRDLTPGQRPLPRFPQARPSPCLPLRIPGETETHGPLTGPHLSPHLGPVFRKRRPVQGIPGPSTVRDLGPNRSPPSWSQACSPREGESTRLTSRHGAGPGGPAARGEGLHPTQNIKVPT